MHPLVLDEFAALLTSPRVLPRRMDPRLLSSRLASPPRARVYVLDAAAPRPFFHALLADLRSKAPAARLFVVAQKFSESDALTYLRLGVRGLLTYSATRAQLSLAVEAVAAGGFWVPRAWLSRFVDAILSGPDARRTASVVAGRARLSRREQQVFDALLENLSNKEIASRLNISERTIKFHVSNVLTKFAVRRRADLILHFSQHAT